MSPVHFLSSPYLASPSYPNTCRTFANFQSYTLRTPAAKFQVQLRGFNYDEKDMICADIFIDFMRRPGSA